MPYHHATKDKKNVRKLSYPLGMKTCATLAFVQASVRYPITQCFREAMIPVSNFRIIAPRLSRPESCPNAVEKQ